MKTYTVTYTIKANKKEWDEEMTVEAASAKEACKMVKELVKKESGRNAFTPSAKRA